jgi:hypothetical protein
VRFVHGFWGLCKPAVVVTSGALGINSERRREGNSRETEVVSPDKRKVVDVVGEREMGSLRCSK